jgi:hypothetical protein
VTEDEPFRLIHVRLRTVEAELRLKASGQSHPQCVGTETVSIGNDRDLHITRPLNQSIDFGGRDLRRISGNDEHGTRRSVDALTRKLDRLVQTQATITHSLDTDRKRYSLVGTDDDNSINSFRSPQ